MISICLNGAMLIMDTRYDKPFHNTIMIVTTISFISIGAVRFTDAHDMLPEHHVVRYCDTAPILATITGAIISPVTHHIPTGPFAKFDRIHQSTGRFTLQCHEIKNGDQWQPISGNGIVTSREPVAHLTIGDTVTVTCWLSKRSSHANQGGFDRKHINLWLDTLVSLRVKTAAQIALTPKPKTTCLHYLMLKTKLQQWAFHMLNIDLVNNPKTNAMINALLLGIRDGQYNMISNDFMISGTMHYLSISGFHVGLLAWIIWGICRLLRLPRTVQSITTILFIILFIFIVPSRSPIIRAGIITIIFTFFYMTRRKSQPLNLLCFAYIVILVLNPLDLFSGGFQLSFLITASIIVFSNALYHYQWIPSRKIILIEDKQNSKNDLTMIWLACIKYFKMALLISLLSWFISLPIGAYHFNRIPLLGWLASLVLLLPITGTLILALSKLIITPIFPFVGNWIATVLNIISEQTLIISHALSKIPYMSINTAQPSLAIIIMFYIIIVLCGYQVYHKQKIPNRYKYAVIFVIICFIWQHPFIQKQYNKEQLALHMLNVSHGLCIVAQLSTSEIICYDVGSMYNFHVAKTDVIPFLRYHGINTIDKLFISHANIDHYVGLIELCDTINVLNIYLPKRFVTDATKHTPARHLLRLLIKMNIPVNIIDQTTTLGESITVIWPPKDLPPEVKANDTSLVIKLNDEKQSVLLTGDIESYAQSKIIAQTPSHILKCDTLILPHHGSITTNPKPLIDAVAPTRILNSSKKLSQHHLETLKKLTKIKIEHTNP
jgi:competence protein ComEC